MVLVVDIGNTDTKFGIFVDDELKARWAIHSDLNRNADEHAVLLKAMLAHIGGYDIEAAIVGSVVPVLTGPVAAAVEGAAFGTGDFVAPAWRLVGARELARGPN